MNSQIADLYIVMPIYNAAATVERAVKSLRCIATKNRQRVLLLGVDDGSTDESARLFLQAAASVSGLRWNLLRRRNGGSGAARNDALRQYSEGWTLCLDADDELVSDPFEYLGQHPDATALIFDALFFREGKKIYRMPARMPKYQTLQKMFSAGNSYHPLSLIFRREMLECNFAEDLRFLEDWYFLAMNPRIFSRSAICRGVALGKVHSRKLSKSADQEKNGFYRVEVANRLTRQWLATSSRIVLNNLFVQQQIGKLQMGQKVSCRKALRFPLAASLLAKFIIYRFFYRQYLQFYPYA